MQRLDRFLNMLFSFGAAVVIWGARLKITHRPGADEFLTIGLCTEVGIFIVMGIQELLKKPEENHSRITGTMVSDNSELVKSVDNLNRTIKKVFNQGG